MTPKSERKPRRKGIVTKYMLDDPSMGFDEITFGVNRSYRRTGGLRKTMSETRLPFDLVWEMVGETGP